MTLEIVVSALATAVLTGAAAYIHLGRRMVTRDDLEQLTIAPRDAAEVCETHCPYVPDRGAIQKSLEQLARTVDTLERRSAKQAELLAEVRGDVRTLIRRGGAA